MKTQSALVLALLGLMMASLVSAEEDNSRFLRAMSRRRLDGGRCWSWCRNGKSSGGWWGWAVTCSCYEGWTGKCCSEIKKCEPNALDICPWSRMEERTAQCANALDFIRVAGNEMPKQLQGVFWLQKQADSSAIMSFAQSNDGGHLSTGKLSSTDKYEYSVRVGGDRVWSFHDKSTSWKLVEFLDLVYNFDFDDAENPTFADIIPESKNLGISVTAELFLNFDMKLLKTEEKEEKYKDVIVWGRPSYVFNNEITSKYYELVQVVDGKGKKTAAFEDWVKYCNDPVTGETQGLVHYREATN